MKRSGILLLAAVMLLSSCGRGVPAAWMAAWDAPSTLDRPVKIVHGLPGDESPYGGDYITYLRDSCGVGGVVLNYSGPDYLKDEAVWDKFVSSVRRAADAGLRVWVYDEQGYPSPAAGGRVLEVDPSLEALEMVRDGDRYYVRDSYEYTHACNNYSALRRYPDPGNPRTIKVFTDVTHDAVRSHLGPELFSKVEAFFTDEPSYMGVNLGPIPEKVRRGVRVQDEPDYTKKLLPMLAWTEGIDKEYSDKYGELLAVPSLFAGDTEADKVVRQRYWELMGERFRANFCDSLQKWCAGAGTLSSGHFLSEEQVIRHTPLYGNMLLVERGLDIPGLDMLDTDPGAWNMVDCWFIASLPESAAYLDGKRRIFSEISDHNQNVLGDCPATIEAMKGTASCHIAGGVTELELYYGIDLGERAPYRTASGFRSYCDFVGRLNSVVREAEPVKKVLLYYPAYDLQREFIPETEPLMDEHNQSAAMKSVIGSFFDTGRAMAQAQVPFVLADYLALDGAGVVDGSIVIGEHAFDAIVIPEASILPDATVRLVEAFKAGGGKVVSAVQGCTPERISSQVAQSERFFPANPRLTYGRFERDGRTIHLVLNASDAPYEGTLTVGRAGNWTAMDPDTGGTSAIVAARTDAGGLLPVSLTPLQTLLYVSPK